MYRYFVFNDVLDVQSWRFREERINDEYMNI